MYINQSFFYYLHKIEYGYICYHLFIGSPDSAFELLKNENL